MKSGCSGPKGTLSVHTLQSKAVTFSFDWTDPSHNTFHGCRGDSCNFIFVLFTSETEEEARHPTLCFLVHIYVNELSRPDPAAIALVSMGEPPC